MKENILILGNGISRLAYESFIMNWNGEMWGCNRAYIDYGKKLTRIAGHSEVMHDAKMYREKKNLKYKIIGGHLGEDPSADFLFTCDKKYQENTGSALAAEALTLGANIIVIGFDMGGKDVYSPAHDVIKKNCWVTRWRWMLQEFGEEKIHFIGHDHKPFLLSNKPASEYWEQYGSGKPHIPGESYEKIHKKWKDVDRTFEGAERVYLKNIGRREWTIYGKKIKSGDGALFPEGYALKYKRLYPSDFQIKEKEENGKRTDPDNLEQRTKNMEPEKCRRRNRKS